MGEIIISIIVPVYRVELYIERCARSLMEQTLTERIEFIFIDDGSPDDSMDILQKVINQYPHRRNQIVIVRHETNKGITYTRSEGISLAQGDYIGWCDSDDWVDPNYYDLLLSATDHGKNDIVFSDHIKDFGDKQEFGEYPSMLSPKHYLRYFNDPQLYCPYLWAHLIRSSLYRKCVNAVVPVNFGEDNYLLIYVYNESQNVVHVQRKLYHYNLANSQSLCHRDSDSYSDWLSQRENLIRIESELSKNTGKDKCQRAVNCLKFGMKSKYRRAFASDKDFFNEFRNSHWYLLYLPNTSLMLRVKLFFIYSFYPFFRIVSNEK